MWLTITKASKQSIDTVNQFSVPLSLTPPGLNYNQGGNNFVTLHAAVPKKVSMSLRKATFTMKPVNITIHICYFVWCALHRATLFYQGCQNPFITATYTVVVKVDTQIVQEASTVTFGIIKEVNTNTNLSIIIEN